MGLTPQARKAKESEINERIEAIRRRNEDIQRRYEEIEKDRENEEALSREALARMKEMATDGAEEQPPAAATAATAAAEEQHEEEPGKKKKMKNPQQLKQRKSGKKLTSDPPPSQHTLTYRPQRLSQGDLPPEGPLYTYLTDRLREGALCSPISPESRRRRRSSASSEMSFSSQSSGYQSRKVSTASNSSWTSDASSSTTRSTSYDGFANYQPPTPLMQRKYSGTHEYIKGRRMSNAEIASGIAELRNVNERIPENLMPQLTVANQSVAEESCPSWNTTSTTNGNGGATWKREKRNTSNKKKDNATEISGNWRQRHNDTPTIESVVASLGNLELTTNQITEEDLNNNEDLNNRNINS